jgi:hypothetical protein
MYVIAMNPDGDYPAATVSYQLNNTYIWHIDNPIIGQWFITVTTRSPGTSCNYRNYSQNVQNTRTDYDMFWAITETVVLDGFGVQPIFGIDNLTNYRSILYV